MLVLVACLRGTCLADVSSIEQAGRGGFAWH
jgi:hypothetical protein